jgi:uncharacterized membrane protein YphA (DoxX/SURF4 family)
MNQRSKTVLYWILTGFLAFAMLAQGLTQVLQVQGYVDMIVKLGYPLYLLTVIGIWKILGVIAILIPRYVLLKEWAYAGFFFVMSGALFSHLANRDPILDILPSVFLLMVIFGSWYWRPIDRKFSVSPN